MIRPLTLITAMLFVLSGAYLFEVKHRSQVLNDQIAAATQAARLDAQRIGVLQAQWALEVDPSRLAQLSAQFTKLQPMKPGQLVTLGALSAALPPPGSAPPGLNPGGQAPAQLTVASLPASVTPPPVAQALPSPPPAKPPAPVRLASSVAPSPSAVRHIARQRHFMQEYAQNQPVAFSRPTVLVPPALPQPVAVPQVPVVPVRAMAYTAPTPALPADGGSMLGMAQNLPGNGSAN